MKKKKVEKVIVVSDKNAYKVAGAWDVIEPALKKAGIEYVIYDGVVPNPTTDNVNEAAKKAKEFGVQAVIGICGGSSIDTAKSVAVLLDYPEKTAEDLYE